MTRAQAEAFLGWLEQAKIVAAYVPEGEEDPTAREERERMVKEVLEIFAPAGEIIDTLFFGKPDEGLKYYSDKKTGVMEKIVREKNPRVALS